MYKDEMTSYRPTNYNIQCIISIYKHETVQKFILSVSCQSKITVWNNTWHEQATISYLHLKITLLKTLLVLQLYCTEFFTFVKHTHTHCYNRHCHQITCYSTDRTTKWNINNLVIVCLIDFNTQYLLSATSFNLFCCTIVKQDLWRSDFTATIPTIIVISS